MLSNQSIVAILLPGEMDYQTVYARADAALYRAKADGRNLIVSAEENP